MSPDRVERSISPFESSATINLMQLLRREIGSLVQTLPDACVNVGTPAGVSS
jgi:hypothetical protein